MWLGVKWLVAGSYFYASSLGLSKMERNALAQKFERIEKKKEKKRKKKYYVKLITSGLFTRVIKFLGDFVPSDLRLL